jgi:polyisoprenoid-binding protein YceI
MKRLKHALFVIATVVALTFTAAAQTSTFQLDSQHSSAQFSTRHLLISTVRGDFHNVTGTLYLDEKDISKSRVEATIDTTTIDTREPKRDAHLKSADFLDVANFPTMTFKSTKVEKAGEGKLRVTGDLTIRGVTKPVVLEVEGPTPEIKDPWGNTRRGATAKTKINRFDYGVSWNKTFDAGGLVVGETVEITIDLEMIKKV